MEVKALLKPTPPKRMAYYLFGEALASFLGALPFLDPVGIGIPGFLGVFSFSLLSGFYRMKWGAFGLRDVLRTATGALMGAIMVASLSPAWYIPFVWFSVALPVLLVFRGARVFWRWLQAGLSRRKAPRCLLVCGAESIGAAVEYALDSAEFPYRVIGAITEAEGDVGSLVQGVKVLGTLEQVCEVVRRHRPDAIVVMDAPNGMLRRVWELLDSCKVEVLLFTPAGGTRRLSLADVIGRPPVKIDFRGIRDFIRGKRVLVTGAGGSIGSALAKQLVEFEPATLVLLDREETALFRVEEELRSERVVAFLGDITDPHDLEAVFATYGPEIVFHAAAYKHVPVLERYPEKALYNNVLGTYALAERAVEFGVRVFVNISTDKAVEPVNVMGASKALAERVVASFNGLGETVFLSVRFGNVFGSRGSVVELFEKWLDEGKPIKITHPNMERYFMSIEEAVLLVLEAASQARPGVFVLNMGRPVKIYELARNMAKLRGLELGVDVPVEFVGPRPGEKLSEKLFWNHERAVPIAGGKVFIAEGSFEVSKAEMDALLLELSQLSGEELRAKLVESAYALASMGRGV